jgi:hypothetical protein
MNPLLFTKKLFVRIAFGLELITVRYIRSRQVRLGLASRHSATMPAAIGAAADVPVVFIDFNKLKFEEVYFSLENVNLKGLSEMSLTRG